jgi:hypothetical protein
MYLFIPKVKDSKRWVNSSSTAKISSSSLSLNASKGNQTGLAFYFFTGMTAEFQSLFSSLAFFRYFFLAMPASGRTGKKSTNSFICDYCYPVLFARQSPTKGDEKSKTKLQLKVIDFFMLTFLSNSANYSNFY